MRNGPGEAPDARALNEYTQEVLTRRLNSDLQQEVSAAAVAVGNVPGHFQRYSEAMRRALPKANLRTTDVATSLGEMALATLTTKQPSATAANKVADSPLGRSTSNNSTMLIQAEDQRFREQMMQSMAHMETVKESLSQPRLRTVLEMTTDPSGALAHVSIIEKSGDIQFDESVLHFSRKIARELPETDDKMLGHFLWKSRWQFTWEPPQVKVRLLTVWRLRDDPALQ